MFRRSSPVLGTIGIMLLAAGAVAQTAGDPGDAPDGGGALTGTGDATASSEAFNELSPGNKIIAEALFEAQVAPAGPTAEPPPGDGSAETPGEATNGTSDTLLAAGATAPWTLDRIATAKAGGQGWGEIFHQMQADGVITARNLGQVVSEHHHRMHFGTSTSPGRTGMIVITDGHNGTTVVGAEGSDAGPAASGARGHARFGAGGQAHGNALGRADGPAGGVSFSGQASGGVAAPGHINAGGGAVPQGLARGQGK